MSFEAFYSSAENSLKKNLTRFKYTGMVRKIKNGGKSKLNKLKKLLTMIKTYGIVKTIKKEGNYYDT